jgi:hypothetical protein
MTHLENIPKRTNGNGKKIRIEDIMRQCVIRKECPTFSEYWLCDGRGERYNEKGERIVCNKYLPFYVR